MRTCAKPCAARADGNWNQTFYLLYFRTLGDRQNQEAFLAAGADVSPTKSCCANGSRRMPSKRCFSAPRGLLDTLPRRRLHARSAAQISSTSRPNTRSRRRTLRSGRSREIRPANHPVLRLAQAAEFFASGRVHHGTRHGLPHGRGRPAAFLRSKRSDYWRTHHIPGDRRRRTVPSASGAFKANIIGHQPRRRPAIRLRKLHRQRTSARQRPDAPRTPAGRGQPLHAPHGRPPACVRATPSNRRPCCNWPPNTAPHAAARSVPSDGGSQKASPKIDKSQKMSIFVRFRTRTEKTINALWI